MRIEVYKASNQDKLRLELRQDYGCVDLVAVNDVGRRVEGGLVLTVQPDGIKLWTKCKCGLPTDNEGRVVIL